METAEISCEKRESKSKGSLNSLRRAGRVPAVLYGRGTTTTNVAVNAIELKDRVAHASTMRLMKVKSDASDINGKHVILKEIQRTPVSREIIHADFYEVDLNRAIHVRVPFKFTGRAQGIMLGGIFQPLEREVELECLPLEIPEFVEVDVTPLGIHDVIHISSVNFAGNIKPIYDTDYPVATVLPPTVAEAPVAAAPAEGEAAEAAAAAPAEGAAAAPEGAAKEAAGAKKAEPAAKK